MSLLIALLCSLFSTLTLAVAEDPYYEVSELFHQRSLRFNCTFVNSEVQRIRRLTKSEFTSEISAEASRLRSAASDVEETDLRTDLRTLAQELETSRDSKERFIDGLEAICRGSRSPLLFGARSLALSNSFLLQSLIFPLTSSVSFFNGVFNRRKTELGPRRDFIYRALGPKRSVGSYALGILASETANYILTPNPVLSVLNVSIALEMLTNYRCFHRNEFDAWQTEFCQDYARLQDFFHRGHTTSFKKGHELQLLIDREIMRKRATLSRDKFCAFSERKQIRRARNLLRRHTYLAQDPRILEAHVLLPIHRNRCTKLLFYTDQEPSSLTRDYPSIEGVEIVALKKGTFPEAYYFNAVELRSMSFEDSLCYEVETAHFGQFLTGRIPQVRDLLSAALTPSLLAAPRTSRIVMPDALLRKGTTSDLRNIIFSIGISDSAALEVERLRAEQKVLRSLIEDDYKRILKAGKFQGCKDVLRRRGVELSLLETSLRRLGEIGLTQELKAQSEFEGIEKLFRKERHRLKLSWELRRSNSLQEIDKALKSGDVANVIIISHGKPSGHLVDVLGQEFPRESFNEVSPSIQSINFYSCYSQKLISLYDLERKLSRSSSFHKVRYVTSVTENDFMGSGSFAPVSAFGYYLGQLDSFLALSAKGSQLLQTEFGENFKAPVPEQLCRIDVSDLRIQRGAYAITLNAELVTTIKSEDTTPEVHFPCRYLREGPNTLRIKSIMNQGESIIGNLKDFSLVLGETRLDQTNATLRLNSMVIFRFTK